MIFEHDVWTKQLYWRVVFTRFSEQVNPVFVVYVPPIRFQEGVRRYLRFVVNDNVIWLRFLCRRERLPKAINATQKYRYKRYEWCILRIAFVHGGDTGSFCHRLVWFRCWCRCYFSSYVYSSLLSLFCCSAQSEAVSYPSAHNDRAWRFLDFSKKPDEIIRDIFVSVQQKI